jgi:large subunit ribosomal protein L23
MQMGSIYDIIRSPLISEKSTMLGVNNQYVFKVDVKATKKQIKKAVEKIFEVKVVSVNTINVLGKVKRFKGVIGKQKDFKKAIVKIESSKELDLSVGIK